MEPRIIIIQDWGKVEVEADRNQELKDKFMELPKPDRKWHSTKMRWQVNIKHLEAVREIMREL